MEVRLKHLNNLAMHTAGELVINIKDGKVYRLNKLSLNLLYGIEDTLISQGCEKISVEASGKEQTIINQVYNFVSTFKAN